MVLRFGLDFSVKLSASSGLAQKFSQLRPASSYLAGLWDQFLVAALMWLNADNRWTIERLASTIVVVRQDKLPRYPLVHLPSRRSRRHEKINLLRKDLCRNICSGVYTAHYGSDWRGVLPSSGTNPMATFRRCSVGPRRGRICYAFDSHTRGKKRI